MQKKIMSRRHKVKFPNLMEPGDVVGVDDVFWRGQFPAIPYLNNLTMFRIGALSQFGDEIPASAIEKLCTDLAKGSFKPPKYEFRKDLNDDTYGYYKNGIITLSVKLIKSAYDDGKKRWFLLLVMLEEFGHHLDYVLRNVYSNIGGDAKGDEGTRFAADFLWFNELLDKNFMYATFHFERKDRQGPTAQRKVAYTIEANEVNREERAKHLLYVEDRRADQGVVRMKDGTSVVVEFYKIRGNGAVHEDITKSAAEKAGVPYDNALDEGCAWPDVPCDTNKVETCYYKTYKEYKKTGTLSCRSHYGDLQYWHSMAPTGNWTNQEVLEKIIAQAKEWYEAALQQNQIFHIGKILHTVQDSYSRSHVVRVQEDETPKPSIFEKTEKVIHVKDGDTLESVASEHGMTWQELAEYNWDTHDPDQINIHLRNEVGCTKKIGANYIFESSNKPGLIKVPVAKEETLIRKKNQVLSFQSYAEQDEHKHGEADKAKSDWTTAEGALDARDTSAQILFFFKNRAAFSEVEKYLREVVYPFAPRAADKPAGGSLLPYKKS